LATTQAAAVYRILRGATCGVRARRVAPIDPPTRNAPLESATA